jgi:hypothetical protein
MQTENGYLGVIVSSSVTIKDFQPINTWEVEPGSPYILDMTTERRYWNEPKSVVRIKAALLALGTPIVHLAAAVGQIAIKAIQLASFSHFWIDREGEYDFKARLSDAGVDLLKLVAAPLALVGLELAAIFALFMPYDGRKLYATMERAQYGHFVLAPCFQPDPESHAFGGIEIAGARF